MSETNARNLPVKPCPSTRAHDPHDSDATPGNPGSRLAPPVHCPGVPVEVDGSYLHRHLIEGHGYSENGLVGLDPLELHRVHASQPPGRHHHVVKPDPRPTDPMTTTTCGIHPAMSTHYHRRFTLPGPVNDRLLNAFRQAGGQVTEHEDGRIEVDYASVRPKGAALSEGETHSILEVVDLMAEAGEAVNRGIKG